jgi:hypothetical protein
VADRCSRLGTAGNPRPEAEAEADTDCRLAAEADKTHQPAAGRAGSRYWGEPVEAVADKKLRPVAGAEGADSFHPGEDPGCPLMGRARDPRVVWCSRLLDSVRSRFERLFVFKGINYPVSTGVTGPGRSVDWRSCLG